MKTILLAMLFALPMLAQQAPETTEAPKQETPVVQKADEPKLTPVFFTYSVVEKAQQALVAEEAAPLVKEAIKLFKERAKLIKSGPPTNPRIEVINKRLTELTTIAAEIGKTLVVAEVK